MIILAPLSGARQNSAYRLARIKKKRPRFSGGISFLNPVFGGGRNLVCKASVKILK